jgi:hypothetical protein
MTTMTAEEWTSFAAANAWSSQARLAAFRALYSA